MVLFNKIFMIFRYLIWANDFDWEKLDRVKYVLRQGLTEMQVGENTLQIVI